MKCINKFTSILLTIVISMSLLLNGCSSKIDMAYNPDTNNSAFKMGQEVSFESSARGFAEKLCVSDNDLDAMKLSIDEAEAGGLFDVTAAETIYAKNIHKKMNPASLTKVMTAYIALKYGHLEDILTASSNVVITESGAQLLGLKEGDKMTLEQALYALLIYSANDAAVLIAEYLSGSVESFSETMNKEARKLGATNTNFANPHGLTDEAHYTTAYDLYLIFNAAMQNEEFRKIINTTEYEAFYKTRDGVEKKRDVTNTNGYLSGTYETPSNVTIIGGKTGTTKAAGSCLILLSNGNNGHTYISVVLHSEDHDSLYKNMTTLLTDIP